MRCGVACRVRLRLEGGRYVFTNWANHSNFAYLFLALSVRATRCIMRGKTIIETVLVFALTTFSACRGRTVEAAHESQSAINHADQNFMTKAAQSDSAEIGMARMALEKSANNDVKDYAHMIDMDHRTALDDLKDLMIQDN